MSLPHLLMVKYTSYGLDPLELDTNTTEVMILRTRAIIQWYQDLRSRTGHGRMLMRHRRRWKTVLILDRLRSRCRKRMVSYTTFLQYQSVKIVDTDIVFLANIVRLAELPRTDATFISF